MKGAPQIDRNKLQGFIKFKDRTRFIGDKIKINIKNDKLCVDAVKEVDKTLAAGQRM